MENRQAVIDSIWASLQGTSRMKVNQVLATMGLSKNMYAKAEDEAAKKMVLGLATRLDDAALGQVAHMIR